MDGPFNISALIRDRTGDAARLHRTHVNPAFETLLHTLGFDRVYVRAEGPYLWDREGLRYLDFMGGYATVNVGRNHPVIRTALAEVLALDHPSLVQFETPLLSGLLAEALATRMPASTEPLTHVFFTNSGTEAVEAAIKFARTTTGRPAIIGTVLGFHGLTLGSLSINGNDSLRSGFEPLLPGCRIIPFDDLPALAQELQRGDVAAFVVEPIQGKGVNIASAGFLREAAALCRRFGALFVVDEVQTGVGRTGSFLAIDHEGDVDPDIVVMSKALSGGYMPIGATITRPSIWNKVFSSLDRALVHSSTFHQGSLAMVAGLATLHVHDSEKLSDQAHRMGAMLFEGLEAMIPRFEFMRAVRQRGLMIGIELGPPRSLRLKAMRAAIDVVNPHLFAQAAVIPLMRDHRILTQVAAPGMPVVKLSPPLVIEESDVRWFLDAWEAVMVQMHRVPGPAWDLLTTLARNTVRARPEPRGGHR